MIWIYYIFHIGMVLMLDAYTALVLSEGVRGHWMAASLERGPQTCVCDIFRWVCEVDYGPLHGYFYESWLAWGRDIEPGLQGRGLL